MRSTETGPLTVVLAFAVGFLTAALWSYYWIQHHPGEPAGTS